ncbi:hypothetical protein V8G54_011156 [Vigna mungo]|uniref:Secreted protein n=1 Tax=Vigna mungo TaxID=3915 RepID=A0AAQ3NNA6_VIGMU
MRISPNLRSFYLLMLCCQYVVTAYNQRCGAASSPSSESLLVSAQPLYSFHFIGVASFFLTKITILSTIVLRHHLILLSILVTPTMKDVFGASFFTINKSEDPLKIFP